MLLTFFNLAEPLTAYHLYNIAVERSRRVWKGRFLINRVKPKILK